MSYFKTRMAEIDMEIAAKRDADLHLSIERAKSAEEEIKASINQPKVGFVYFLKSGPLVKIGFSTQIENRMRHLRSANPHDMVIIGFVPGTDDTEYFLHQMFSKYRETGEWFRVEGDLLAFISNLPRKQKVRKRGPKRLDKDQLKELFF